MVYLKSGVKGRFCTLAQINLLQLIGVVKLINWFAFVIGILARVTEGDKSDMQKLGYEYIRLVIKHLHIPLFKKSKWL